MKKLRKKNYKCKGMTLVEIIISLFIFTVMAAMMVQIGEVINNLTRNANHVNRKVAAEAPLAENEVTNSANGLTTVTDDNLKIQVQVGAYTAYVKGQTYSTDGAVAGNTFANTNADIDLEFVAVDLQKKTGENLWEDPDAEDPDAEDPAPVPGT